VCCITDVTRFWRVQAFLPEHALNRLRLASCRAMKTRLQQKAQRGVVSHSEPETAIELAARTHDMTLRLLTLSPDELLLRKAAIDGFYSLSDATSSRS